MTAISNKTKLVSLAIALAALPGVGAPMPALASTESKLVLSETAKPAAQSPNRLVTIGEDIFGFIVSQSSDGIVEARHYSHRSHSSHRSHYSSRY
jgi:hypothetical protein